MVGETSELKPGRLPRDEERTSRIIAALKAAGLDVLVCTLPSNILMLTGYWPVVGTAIGIATREGGFGVVAPEDELEFANNSWADVIRTFRPGSLAELVDTVDAVRGPLSEAGAALGIPAPAKVGHDSGGSFDPAGYAAAFTYGARIEPLLMDAFAGSSLEDASECISRLRSVLTKRELGLVRRACEIAGLAYVKTVEAVRAGMTELEVAARFTALLKSQEDRADGFGYCMSGPNSAKAFAAFQMSTSRRIERGDAVMLHCNSYFQGFWTDITRTYCVEPDSPGQRAAREAILQASREAIASVRPGVRGCEVDAAARRVLSEHGMGMAFKHPTGHGVGFAAIDHNARPRIHPLSEEILEPGMVFNIEPGVYFDSTWGMRHCDMVVVTDSGVELLTPFHSESAQLMLP